MKKNYFAEYDDIDKTVRLITSATINGGEISNLVNLTSLYLYNLPNATIDGMKIEFNDKLIEKLK